MDLGLTGRTALVAAGTSGLGFGTAAALLAEGVDVSICGRDRDRLDAALTGLRERTGDRARVHGATADVRDPDALRSWVAAAETVHGPTDIVVANAGGPPKGGAERFAVDDYRQALELNLLPSIDLVELVLPGMRRRGWGRVLLLASVSVLDPLAGLALSNVARPGLIGYAKSLVAVLGDEPVTVNVLAPGAHDTPRTSGSADARRGDPADFGAIATFVCSRQASYVHGAVLPVDGGAHGGLL